MSTAAIEEMPYVARRALALWTTLGVLGFDHDHRFIVASESLDLDDLPRMEPPPGDVFLLVTLERGKPGDAEYSIVAGTVDRTWWEDGANRKMSEAWNALTKRECDQEWAMWVKTPVLTLIMAQMVQRGIELPAYPELDEARLEAVRDVH